MNRRETALFALAASGLAALLFSEVLRGRVLYFQDFGGAFEPLRHALGAAFRSGKLPLWNDLISNGQTFVGNPFAEVTYAPNLIFAVDASPARLLSLLTALHVAWAMLGACVLARTLGGSRTGSLVAGALFGAGGAFVSATYMTTLVNTASWIPWLCAFHVKNEDDTDAEKGWRTPLALAAIAIMAVTAGDPTMLLAGALGTLVLSRSPRSFLKTARVYAVTFLLMTPLLGLWARNAADTDRGAGLARSEALSRSLPPLELLGVMAPHFFGDGPLSRDELVTPGSADGNGLRLFPGLYVGALGVALVIAGVGVRRSSEEEFGDEAPVETRSRLGLRLAIWAVSLLLLSLGRYGPFHALLTGLPILHSLRLHAKWFLVASLPLALLAGRGIDHMAREIRIHQVSRRFLSAAMVAMLVPAGLCLVARSGPPRFLLPPGASADAARAVQERVLSTSLRGSVALVLVVGLLIARRRAPRLPVAGAAACILAADLLLANHELLLTTGLDFYRVPQTVAAIRSDPQGHDRVWVDPRPASTSVDTPISPERPDAGLAALRERLAIYTPIAYGLKTALSPDLESFRGRSATELRWLAHSWSDRELVLLLGMAGVTHLVTFSELGSAWALELASLDVHARKKLHVYRNRWTLARARFVSRLFGYDRPATMMNALENGPDDMLKQGVFVEAGEIPELRSALGVASEAGVSNSALIREDRGNEMTLETEGRAGFLVLGDSFAPAWRATIDGGPVRIFRGNLAFRVIAVPAGRHVVRFSYLTLF